MKRKKKETKNLAKLKKSHMKIYLRAKKKTKKKEYLKKIIWK